RRATLADAGPSARPATHCLSSPIQLPSGRRGRTPVTISNPTPQRHLRAHRADRLTDRAALTTDHHTTLAGRLTPRDRWLVRMLHEHRVLTSTQLTQLAFTDTRLANRRLRELYQHRVVDRFQPFR